MPFMSTREWRYDGRAWLWFGWGCVAAAYLALAKGSVLGALIQLGWAVCGFAIGTVKRRRWRRAACDAISTGEPVKSQPD
jgi:hypothetical protein